MKNGSISRILLGVSSLMLASAPFAHAAQPIRFADTKAKNDIALAVDIHYGSYAPLSKSVRSRIPGWYKKFITDAREADNLGNQDGIVQDYEAEKILEQAYVSSYNGGVAWAQ